MTRLNPWVFGVVVAITVVIGYTLCTLFWFALTEQSIGFLNTLFHGMDFHKIYAATDFSLVGYLSVVAVFTVWGYVIGVVYATARNLLIGRG
jgi:hypothetical protein